MTCPRRLPVAILARHELVCALTAGRAHEFEPTGESSYALTIGAVPGRETPSGCFARNTNPCSANRTVQPELAPAEDGCASSLGDPGSGPTCPWPATGLRTKVDGQGRCLRVRRCRLARRSRVTVLGLEDLWWSGPAHTVSGAAVQLEGDRLPPLHGRRAGVRPAGAEGPSTDGGGPQDQCTERFRPTGLRFGPSAGQVERMGCGYGRL